MQKNEAAKLITNSIIFLSTAIIAVTGILFGAGNGQVGNYVIGIGYFKPYTMDSNILGAVSSLITVFYSMKSLVSKKDCTPRWAVTFQLMSTTSLCLTFLIVVFFLAPMKVMEGQSYFMMFSNDMFFYHLVNPVLAVISFICLQKKFRYTRKSCILGIVPTFIYSMVYMFMVAVFKIWEDFYNFTFGGRYYLIPVVLLVIYSLVFLIANILIRLHNKNVAA